MARKAKVVAPVVESEVAEVVAPEVEVIDFGPVCNPDGSPTAATIEILTGQPSLTSQLVQQVVDAKPAKAEDKAPKSDKNEGVGLFIRKLISEGLSNKAILEIVHEQYGNKNTTYACVAWYRNKMKKAGNVEAKSSALDFINNFAKSNGLSEEAVEVLKSEFKVA